MRGSGLVVAVAGGRNLETVLKGVRARLAEDSRIIFPRRIITRPITDGDELHQSVTPAQFEELRRNDRFFVVWSEGGRNYGLPREIDTALGRGRCVVVPVEAAGLAALCRTAPRVALLRLDSPDDRLEDESDLWRCDEDIILTVQPDPARTVDAAVAALRRLARPGSRRSVRPGVTVSMSSKGH